MSNDPSPLKYLGTQSQETLSMAAAMALVWCADLFCTYRPTRARAALARVTLARMSSARAVQMNGLGLWL